MKKIIAFYFCITQLYCNAIELNITYQPQELNCMRMVHLHKQCHKNADGGFFSEFNNLIANIIRYENKKIKSVYVDWTHPLFPYKDDPNDNGWDLYFEPVYVDQVNNQTPEKIKTVYNHYDHELHNFKCTCIWTRYDAYLPYRLFAHEKIKKHIRIKRHILDAVDTFYTQYMQKYPCIGVQVRNASAHQKEAPFGHQSIKKYFSEIDTLLNDPNMHNASIYLATDNQHIITEFQKVYGHRLLYLDTYRANENKDHTQEAKENFEQYHSLKPGYRGGLGALMDCLLLARCNYFVHITSNLAQAVTFFNPYIKSIFLPTDAPYIPCKRYGDRRIRNPYINPF